MESSDIECLVLCVFERLELMIDFLDFSSTWSVQECLDKLYTLHKNEVHVVYNITTQGDELFKDHDPMIIQINHLKQIIHFFQRIFVAYPHLVPTEDIQESLTKILDIYGSRADIDLKKLLIVKCRLQRSTLCSEQIKDILYYFGEDTNFDHSNPENLQKLETVFSLY